MQIEVTNGTCSNVHFQCEHPVGKSNEFNYAVRQMFYASKEPCGDVSISGVLNPDQAEQFARWILEGK